MVFQKGRKSSNFNYCLPQKTYRNKTRFQVLQRIEVFNQLIFHIITKNVKLNVPFKK